LVNDPANSQYIYWSPDGTSFFVELPDSFATTVLPRFFKHSNYSSFVRQLNMYGFRKVPHVQAGALRPDDPDLDQIAEFEHPYFQRGMVDMLQYVSRSKRADRAREE
ncbi:winged helix DNA-binding domain-containing protein, partial [Gonapodya prolifera JEL478]